MTANTDDQLRLLSERIQRLEDEKQGVADDIKDTYAEAKAHGYDVKALRECIKLLKQDAEARQAHRAMVELYGEQLGLGF